LKDLRGTTGTMLVTEKK